MSTPKDIAAAAARTILAGTDSPDLEVVCLHDVEPRPVEWLWPDRIPLGKLTIISGEPGLGKSTLAYDIAARITSCAGWPDCDAEMPTWATAIIMTAEDDLADTVRPRLDAAGAEVGSIHAITASIDRSGKTAKSRMFNLSKDLERLDARLDSMRFVRLIVIDPVTAYLGGKDANDNAGVREVLSPLKELAERHRVAVIAVTHLNKARGQRAMHRSIGSIGFLGAARSAHLVTEDPEDRDRRLFLPIKSNLAARTDGLAYRVIEAPNGAPRIEWEPGTVELSADDALQAAEGGRHRELDEATEWLRNYLASGPRSAKDAWQDADAAGFSNATIRRAKEVARVRSYKDAAFQGAWWWELRRTASETQE